MWKHGLCYILILHVDIKILLYYKSCSSLWSKSLKTLHFFSQYADASLAEPSVVKVGAQGEQWFPCWGVARGLQSLPEASRWGLPEHAWLQPPRVGVFLQCRVTEGQEIQLLCHKGGPRWKSLWSEKRQGALLPGTTCEIQQTRRPGSQAKANRALKPSSPGPLDTWLLT